MSHRFSNSAKIRQEVIQSAMPQKWEDFPQDVRITVLERIQEIVEEILNVKTSN